MGANVDMTKKGATTMNKLRNLIPIVLFGLILTTVVTTVPAAGAQSGQSQSPAAQSQAEQTIQGQLTKVDTDKSTFTIKLSDNSTMEFRYDQNTRVVGSETGVQGLSNETGTNLAIHYTQRDNQNIATTIEILK